MHLLDVNVWLALAFKRHVHHVPATAWFHAASAPRVFCRFTQAGFLRLASNPAAIGPAAVSMADAWRAYDAFLGDQNIMYVEEPEGVEAVWRSHTQSSNFSPKIWNDAYLAAFAQLAGFEVVTFDQAFRQFQHAKSAILK